MQPGQIRYALRIDAAHRVIADLTIWRNENSFEVMSGRHRDIADLVAMQNRHLRCKDLTADTAIFAVQGPNTHAALQTLTDGRGLALLNYFSFGQFVIAGVHCLIGRLGYTGELGVEIIVMLFANDLALEPTVSELGVDPTNTDATAQDRFRFVCCTAKTDHDPVLWRRHPVCATPPGCDEIIVTSACFSTVAQSVLVLGFCKTNTNPDTSLIDRSGTFTDIRQVTRPFFDPDKLKPRGGFIQS